MSKTTTTKEPRLTREQRRSRRKRYVRARTISVKRLSKAALEAGRLEYPEDTSEGKPRTRGDCANMPRPCPYVSCQYHLYLDVSEKTGAIKLNYPDLEVHELAESCALDVADRLGTTLEDAGDIMNLTRERIRQLEVKALAKVQAYAQLTALRDFQPEDVKTVRRLPVINTRFLDEMLEAEEAAE